MGVGCDAPPGADHCGSLCLAASLELADFLASVESEETLRAQRLQDREAKSVLTIIEGGLSKRGDMILNEAEDVHQQDVPDTLNPRIMPEPAAPEHVKIFEEY